MPDSFVFTKETDKSSKLTKNQRNTLAELVSDRWLHTTGELAQLIEESREGWDFYLRNRTLPKPTKTMAGSKLDTSDVMDASQTKLRLGAIPRAVDSVMAVLHNSLFPADERFFVGTPQNDLSDQKQDIYEQFLETNLAQDNTTEELRRFMLTLCIDCAAAVSINWKVKTRKKVTYETPTIKIGSITIPVPVMGLEKKTNPKFVEWEGSHVECLDFNDWRADTAAKNFEDAWFTHRWYLPCWEVEEDFGLKDVEPYHSAYEFEDPIGNRKRESSGLAIPIPFDEEEEGKENALLMASYDDFVIGGKVYKNHVALVLNGQDLIWFGENPYNHGRKPYIVSSLLPIPNQVYGISLIKHAIPSAAVIDTAVQKILKIAALAADPIFEVDMMEPAFRKSRQIKPGMTIPVKNIGRAIAQVQVQLTNLPALENIITKMEGNIREVTGASPMLAGDDFSQQPANITAFQVDQHSQGAAGRFQAIMTNFSNGVLDPLLYMVFENDKQFKEKTEYIRVGTNDHELEPDIIKQLDYKWVITSAQATNTRGKRLANLRSFLFDMTPMLVQNGIIQLSTDQMILKQGAAMQELMILAGMPNADKFLQVVPGVDDGVPPVQPPIVPGAGPPPGQPVPPPGVPGPQVPPQGPPPSPQPIPPGGQPPNGMPPG